MTIVPFNRPTRTLTFASDHEVDLSSNYVVDDLMLQGEVSILSGPSNTGKTALVVRIGACIVQGSPIQGRKVQQGCVVHVCVESPKSARDRTIPILKGKTGEQDYAFFDHEVDLSDPDEVHCFVELLSEELERQGRDISLIVFDTLVRCIGATDENDPGRMTAVLKNAQFIAQRFNAHVLLVHHMGKDQDRGSRGSSVLRTNVDAEFFLKAKEDDDVVRLTQEKQRNLPKGRALRFGLEQHTIGNRREDGKPLTTVVASFEDGEALDDQVQSLSANAMIVLTALKGARKQGAPSLTNNELKDRVPISLMTSSKTVAGQDKAIERALKALVDAGYVEKNKRGQLNAWTSTRNA